MLFKLIYKNSKVDMAKFTACFNVKVQHRISALI
jgi:hypothetical protein